MENNEMRYELILPGNSIRPFEQRMLESGLCSFALPMRFVRTPRGLTVRYERCGYIPLESLGTLPTGQAFEILEKVFLALRTSSEYLLDPASIPLGLNLVYYHPEQRCVRILYLPRCREEEPKSTLRAFLEAYRGRLDAEGLPYMDRILGELDLRGRSLRELANLTGEIRRELYAAGL